MSLKKKILFTASFMLALAFMFSCGENEIGFESTEKKCGDNLHNSKEFSCVVVGECNGLYYDPDYQICIDDVIEYIAFSSSSNSSSSSGGDLSSSSSGGSSSSVSSSSSSSRSVSSASGGVVSPPSGGGGGGGGGGSQSPPQCTAWGALVVTTEPTCDADGEGTRTCTSGLSTTKTEKIPQLVWGEWEEITPATPTTHGEGKRTCENGDVEVKELLLCGGVEYAKDEQRCGTGNVIENKCGSDWYNASNPDLRCHNNSVVETKCGNSWYDATNTNLGCVSGALMTKCGGSWYDPSMGYFCQEGTNTVKPLCGGKEYASNQRCGTDNTTIETSCGTSSWYNPLTQFCQSASGTGTVKPLCDGKQFSATEFCQEGTNKVETLCGGNTFTSAQKCENNVVMNKCGNDWYNPSNQRCGDGNVVETKCGSSSWFNAATQFCQSTSGTGTVKPLCNGQTFSATEFCQAGTPDVVKTLCNGQTFTSAQFCQTGTNTVQNLCNGQTYTQDKKCENGEIVNNGPMCGSAQLNESTHFCDTRDNKMYKYKLITIGSYSKTWMAENLNYDVPSNTTNDDVCYNNSTSNCTTYGRLYSWNTAMAGATSSEANPSGRQGVCPSGWHLPSDAEWTALTNATGVDSPKFMAKSSLWNLNTGTDYYGFSALPSGARTNTGAFQDVGEGTYWWSATESNADNARVKYILPEYGDVARGTRNKGYLLSVRCIKN